MTPKELRESWSECMALWVDGRVTQDFTLDISDGQRKEEGIHPNTLAVINYQTEAGGSNNINLSEEYLRDYCTYNPLTRIIWVKHPMYPELSDNPDAVWTFTIMPMVPFHRIPQAIDKYIFQKENNN